MFSTAKAHYESMDEYIAAQPKAAQAALKRVRSAIRKAVPEAEEVISYHMPAYKLRGRAVLYFAGWKEHSSLYPSTNQLIAALKGELAPYVVSKGTIRFPLSAPVPVKLIEGIARFRAKQEAARQKARAAQSRKR